jgi:CelD/BcsL family acetyltransferase involved in cellulose biosynthesis
MSHHKGTAEPFANQVAPMTTRMRATSTSRRLVADVVRPAELAAADIAAWRAMQAAEPAFASPLLGPDFAMAVGGVRADARVAVFRQGGETVGFLAHHRRPSGFARPIGAPFCDYHALVCDPGAALDVGEALAAAGLGRLRLTGLVDPFGQFEAAVAERTLAHRIILADTGQNYLDALRAASQNRFKNHRRYRRAMEQDLGPVRLVAHDADPTAFNRLMAWKRRQIAESGVHDFLGADWAVTLMRRLHAARGGAFEGLMVSLYAGDRLVAAHFGVRLGDWFHPWIGAFDPALKAYSPGLVHQIEAIGAMSGLGLRTYDLGAGNDHWKQMFAMDHIEVGSGLATATSLTGRIARSCDLVWSTPGAGRVRRRLDQINAVELTLGGRLQGAVHAVGSLRGRRDHELTLRSRPWALS